VEQLSKETQEFLKAIGINDINEIEGRRDSDIHAQLYWMAFDRGIHKTSVSIMFKAADEIRRYKNAERRDEKIEGLYALGAYIEPMELADGTWRWVVTGFAYDEPNVYDEGIGLDETLFKYQGKSKEELLNPFNGQIE
jgi:hypothetical protein